MKNYVIKPIVILLVLIILYSLALTIVFLPDNAGITDRINFGIEILEQHEGIYRRPVIYYDGITTLDNFTDGLMPPSPTGMKLWTNVIVIVT